MYKKGYLSDTELEEYSELRRNEYLERKAELESTGCKNVRAVKDSDDDIIGWTFEDSTPQ